MVFVLILASKHVKSGQRNASRIGMAFQWRADSGPILSVGSAYVTDPVKNNFSVMSRLGWTGSKQQITCLAQGHNTVPLPALSLKLATLRFH